MIKEKTMNIRFFFSSQKKTTLVTDGSHGIDRLRRGRGRHGRRRRVYPASPASGHMTGQTIPVEAGKRLKGGL
jgi:hypothetical protein